MDQCKTRAHVVLAPLGKQPDNMLAIRQTYNGAPGRLNLYELLDATDPDKPTIVARRVPSDCCKWCAVRTWARSL